MWVWVSVCVCVDTGGLIHHPILQSESKAVIEVCFQSTKPPGADNANTTSLALNIQRCNKTR